MMRALGLCKEELSVLLTDDEGIRQLNRTYRGQDRPTDVLAFAMQEGEFSSFAGPLLGDVVVSLSTAGLQAKAKGWPLVEQVTMLLAHGLLHLLGWDHDTAEKDREMARETERLCATAGSPFPFEKKRGPLVLPGGRMGKTGL